MQQPVPWGAYLPYLVARELAADPQASLAGRERRLDAVVLFADISGFTAISEALAASGRGGAEELTGLLNAYLAPAIAKVEQYGGSVGKLGGDAITAVFPYGEGERQAVARRALACALEIQAHVARYAAIHTSAGAFTLTMGVGLADGPLLATVVGAPGARLELVLAGAVLARAAAAERAALPGEVAVTATMLADLDPVEAEPRLPAAAGPARSHYVVAAMGQPPDPAPLPPLGPLSPAAARQAAAFLPPAIARRLESGQASFVNEHRTVTVLFAAFAAPDPEQTPQAGAMLQAYLARVFRVVRRFGGYVNKTQVDDKGSSFLALFGAPLSHEDDAARALQCALELRDLPREVEGPALRVGIASGLVYCGEVGSATHREYTVIGDTVNLAARLMEAAVADQILVADATRRAAGSAFEWGAARELTLRGRVAPATVSPLAGARVPPAEAGLPSAELIGRSDERAILEAALEQALSGHGQVVGLRGEAGVGKTALAWATLNTAARLGARCLRSECLSYRSASGYLAWRPLLRGLVGLDASAPAPRQAERLAERLTAIDPRLSPRLPLLAAALGLPAADSPITRELGPAERRRGLEALALDLIDHAAAEAPLAIVIEGCDWIDPLSRDLLEAVARRAAGLPVLIVLTYRNSSPLGATRLPHYRELSLSELSPEAAERLIARVVARLYGPDAIVPAALVERVAARAQGNPFYIEQLLSLAHERGLDLADERAIAELELPDSLHSLILSRIDRLGEDARTALKVASVIGREFSPRWLSGVYPPLADNGHLLVGLDELSRSDLAIPGGDGPDAAYLFRHALTREVAYASLSRATRADLHERAGDFIERSFPGELDRHLDLLAHHYSLSDNQIKQREYLARAAEAAYSAGASAAAADFYRKLLPLLHRHERSAVLIRLGMALRLSGRWDEAEQVYTEALDLAPDPATAARVRNVIGELMLRRGDYSAAREWLEQALAGLNAAGDREGASEAAEHLAMVDYSVGNYAAALATLEQALERAQAGGRQPRTMQLLNNIGAIYAATGDLERALDCYERCLRLSAELGSRRHIGVAVGNMGNIYSARGDYGKALDCYSQKLQCAQEIGDRLELGIAVLNLGSTYEAQGEYGRATACYLRSLALGLELGDKLGVGVSLWGAGASALGAERFDEARELLDRASDLLRALDAPGDLAPCLLSRAELAVRRADHLEALELLAEALPLAEAGGDAETALRCRLLRAICERGLGRLSPAEAAASVEPLLAGERSDEERAAILYTLVRVDGARAVDRTAAAQIYRALHSRTPNAEYRRRYAELMGVALAPPPPLPPLPAVVVERPLDADELLARADALIAEVLEPA